MDRLLPQAEAANGRVEVLALYNYGEFRVPVLRQRLMEEARGRYLAFVDDDDMVSTAYVEAILAMAEHTPESMGFQVMLEAKHQLSVCSFMKHREAGFSGTDGGLKDGIWYEPWGIMTPTLATIMHTCRFDSYLGRVGEDGHFKQQIVPKLGMIEGYLDAPLYFYNWDENDSSQTGWARGKSLTRRIRLTRPDISSPAFRWHSWSAP